MFHRRQSTGQSLKEEVWSNPCGIWRSNQRDIGKDIGKPTFVLHLDIEWDGCRNTFGIDRRTIKVEGQVLTERESGTLPSQTEVNLKNVEQAKAITLRNGRPIKTAVDLDQEHATELPAASKEQQKKVLAAAIAFPAAANAVPVAAKQDGSIGQLRATSYVPEIPFPQRLKSKKIEEQFEKFLHILKKLEINIPFIDALEQMPTYAKFMKDIITSMKKLGNNPTVKLSKRCSAILQGHKLPEKKKDPGCFDIPCTIGSIYFDKALCDLGSSINLMPLSIARKMGLGEEIKSTSVSLQMADRSITLPKGLIEDVIVKVDTLVFPADFLVIDMETNGHTPIILGWPFLLTGRTLIDVEQGLVVLRVADKSVAINVYKALLYPESEETCILMDTLERDISSHFEKEHPCDPLEACLVHNNNKEMANQEIIEMAQYLDA
ncbi:uncharacterized protein LOC110756196 [Prunus avium]|uniref:Uncharacterized protein LOC110756196 n=1 Tax=Prunus avium TaxID=42229 RepID=A0A6P5SG82_PRUAV|nr:uncharacterized protein LOC110756196 [Prunus avium]